MSAHGSPKSTRIHRPSSSKSSQMNTSQNTPIKPPMTLGDPGLMRHGTLLTSNATPARAAAELKSILGNHNSRLKSKAALIRLDSGSAAFNRHVTLEQAKARARVEVDIFPRTNICVQGGHLRGHVNILIRRATHKEGPIFIAEGKIRVIGFESLGDKSQSIFYQCSAMLASVTPSLDGLYASECDTEGFALAREGEHNLPFALYLSLSNNHGQAKGILKNHSDIALNYIAMVSLKIKDETGRRSIAHFYRSIEVWPRLDPTAILSSALRPLQATVSPNISKESHAGRIKLTASLHRLHWVAGQYCQVKLVVNNGTTRPLSQLTLSLHRTVTIFPHSSNGGLEFDLDTRQPEVTTKQVVESVLEAGQTRSRGHASAKGWWLGVPPKQNSEFEHSLLIPMDALTVPRGRIFEIEYSLQVMVGSGTRLYSDIQVMLPIRIVGFYSIDPPPSHAISTHSLTPLSSQPLSSKPSSKTNTPDPPHLLSQSGSNSSFRKETQNRAFTSRSEMESDQDKILLHDSYDILYEQTTTRELSSDHDNELGNLELGNLPLVDDTDDAVQHAINTARMKPSYGRFSDLYYLQDKSGQIEIDKAYLDDKNEHPTDPTDHVNSESAVGVLETLMKKVALENNSNTDVHGVEMARTRQKFGVRTRSFFAGRVEEKTRIATAAFLNEDRDARVHQEQPEDSPTCDKNGQCNRKPHLTLEISPVLCGEINQSSGDLSQPLHHKNNGFWGLPANSREDPNGPDAPTQSGHSYPPDVARADLERHRKASTIDLSITGTSSQSSICSPVAPPFHQGQSESITMVSVPICSHCTMHMSDSVAPRGLSSIRGLSWQGTLDRLTSDTDSNDSPRDHLTLGIGVVKAATPSAQTSISPASATSTTSTASVGSVSVKDKVRQLEERVKASTSL